ncbi:hypothetical protein J6590_033167 [Homalodisca vitripennis]|nr:hypothetical protein J6590_033167 [Homalodisca vitripennis]
MAESFLPQVIPAHWPVTSIPLWTGLLEGVLLPVILAMTDKAFVRRVATIYSRRRPSDMTKPPQGDITPPFITTLLSMKQTDRQAVDLCCMDLRQTGLLQLIRLPEYQSNQLAPFRYLLVSDLPPFSKYQDGSLGQERQEVRPDSGPGLHGKFRPFNNCLLETQRPMETVRFPITNGSLFTSLDGRIPIIHNYRRTKGVRTTGPLPSYCQTQRYCPTGSVPQEDCGTQMRANIIVADINCDRKTESPLSAFSEPHKPKESGQCYTQRISTSDLRQDTPPFPQNIQQLRETLFLENQDSEDDYEDFEETCEEPIYATLSSRSACSATTAANDDFEFYQQEKPRESGKPVGFKSASLRSTSIRRRISRSSSIDRILTRQETDEEESQSDEGRQHRPMYRQQPPPSHRPRLVRPLSRRLGLPPTPPPPRRLAPVLSVDSLVAALHQADVSYLDTGDLCHHGGSVPDLKKIFYTGFL